MNFKSSSRGSTMAALQAGQQEMERRLKEDTKVAAARYIGNLSLRQDWPKEDVEEVLAALGLKPWTG